MAATIIIAISHAAAQSDVRAGRASAAPGRDTDDDCGPERVRFFFDTADRVTRGSETGASTSTNQARAFQQWMQAHSRTEALMGCSTVDPELADLADTPARERG